MKKYIRLTLLACCLSINTMDQAASNQGNGRFNGCGWESTWNDSSTNSTDNGFAAVSADFQDSTPIPVYDVSREAFILFNDVLSFGKSHQDGSVYNLLSIEDMPNFNNHGFDLEKIGEELREIAPSFVDHDTGQTPKLRPWTVQAFMCNNMVIVRYGNQKLVLGSKNYLTNQPYAKIPVIEARPFRFSSIINSSLFKSSCAATITGLGTYFVIGFYNKGKKKEEQLSQKKWALGAAAVAGIGTFACLQYMTSSATQN